MKRNRFGCPPTLAVRELIICPFLPDTIGLKPYEEDEVGNEVENEVENGGENNNMGSGRGRRGTVTGESFTSASFSSESAVDQSTDIARTHRTQSFDILTPALLPASDWPFSVSDLMQLALGPPSIRNSNSNSGNYNNLMSSREAYELLFECGVQTVKAWSKTVDINLYTTPTLVDSGYTDR